MTVLRPRLGTLTHAHANARPLSSEQSWARHYRYRLLATDTALILLSTIGAIFVRFGFEDTPTTTGEGFRVDYLTVSLLIAATWMFALTAYHTRDPRVVGVGVTEYRRVVAATAITFGLLAIFFLVGKVDIARGYFVLALPLGMGGVLVSRWLWRHWLIKQRTFDHYLCRALVVGRFDDVDTVVRQIHANSGAAYNVVGAALDTGKRTGAKKDAELSRRIASPQREVPVVSDLSGVAEAAARLGADTVIVAGRALSGGDFVRRLAWKLEGTATELVLAAPLTDIAGPRIHFRPVEGLPLIQVEIPQFEGGKHVLKRAFDFFASGLALILLSPVFLAVAVAIKLDDGGPVIFSQERVGRGGEKFRMLKFRSMCVDAEARLAGLQAENEGNGLLFKLHDDPRVTRVGRTLRKYSLDELPQILNVFLGDMSLVGPRPPLPAEVAGYENHVHRRLYIKPGLTGMWQVNGRSDLSWQESVRLDLYYVENWSLTGDLVIMWRTLKVLTHPVGAY
ncbi:sugar transferase [Leifsonia sp. NPDC056824]|uniref:sugar transferase n=1 Tax=Leifsonia sp. NPDC056824 TaxID=3345953 RepID=UPI0036766D42